MSPLTVGDIRKAIEGLPDSAPIFNDVLDGPDEYTVNVVGIEGGIPERWKGVGIADEVKPGLWIHTEIIPMEEENDADDEGDFGDLEDLESH